MDILLISIRIKRYLSGDTLDIKTDAVFVAIGHKPNTEIFDGQLVLDERSYIRRYDGSKTNIKGVLSPVTRMTISTDKL